MGGKPLKRTEISGGQIPNLHGLSLATFARMFRPMSPVIRSGHAGLAMGGSRGGGGSGNTPTETYVQVVGMSKSYHELNTDASHPVGLFGEGVNDQLLVFWFPRSHIWVRVNNRFDIVFDVSHLSALVM